jgi:hypothetical protein
MSPPPRCGPKQTECLDAAAVAALAAGESSRPPDRDLEHFTTESALQLQAFGKR